MRYKYKYTTWLAFSIIYDSRDESHSTLYNAYYNKTPVEVEFNGQHMKLKILKLFTWSSGNTTIILGR